MCSCRNILDNSTEFCERVINCNTGNSQSYFFLSLESWLCVLKEGWVRWQFLMTGVFWCIGFTFRMTAPPCQRVLSPSCPNGWVGIGYYIAFSFFFKVKHSWVVCYLESPVNFTVMSHRYIVGKRVSDLSIAFSFVRDTTAVRSYSMILQEETSGSWPECDAFSWLSTWLDLKSRKRPASEIDDGISRKD